MSELDINRILKNSDITAVEKNFTESGIWEVYDAESKKHYIVKFVDNQELEMTKKASDFGKTLSENSNLRIPEFLGSINENIPQDILDKYKVDGGVPDSSRLMVIEKLDISKYKYFSPHHDGEKIDDAEANSKKNLPVIDQLQYAAEGGEIHPALKGQRITEAEFSSLVNDFKAMKDAKIYNFDVGANLFIERGIDGKISFTLIDFEPHQFIGSTYNASGLSIEESSLEDLKKLDQMRADYPKLFAEPYEKYTYISSDDTKTHTIANAISGEEFIVKTGVDDHEIKQLKLASALEFPDNLKNIICIPKFISDDVNDLPAHIKNTMGGEGKIVIMEKAQGAELKSYIHSYDGNTPKGLNIDSSDWSKFRSGIEFMNDSGVLHYDLKNSENIFVSTDTNGKTRFELIDWGHDGELTKSKSDLDSLDNLGKELRSLDIVKTVPIAEINSDFDDADTLVDKPIADMSADLDDADNPKPVTPVENTIDNMPKPSTDAVTNSKWTKALNIAGESAVRNTGIVLGGYHLYSQLFAENSTFKNDLKNDNVKTRAITALAIDGTVFAAESINLAAKGVKFARGGINLASDLAPLGAGASKLAKISRVAPAIGTVATLVTTTLEISIGYANEDGKRIVEAIGSGGGTVAGAAGGAAFCSWAAPGGPPGWLIVGGCGLVGGIGGGMAGGKAADILFSKVMQEHIDASPLEDQKEKLAQLEIIGVKSELFEKLNTNVVQTYELIGAQYEITNINSDYVYPLAVDDKIIDGLVNSTEGHWDARINLADNIDQIVLSKKDIDALDDVETFLVGRQIINRDVKVPHLTASDDKEALKRIDDNAPKIVAALEKIMDIRIADATAKQMYGATKEDALERANTEVTKLEQNITDRVILISESQSVIHTNNAAEAQQSFEQTLSNRIGRFDMAYGNGSTDAKLIQSSIVLIALVETGNMDAQTFSEASIDIEDIQQDHDQELRQMRTNRARLAEMTQEQKGLVDHQYSRKYTSHNLKTLRGINARTADVVETYKETESLANHAMKAAESAVAILDIKAGKLINTDMLVNGDLNKGTQILHMSPDSTSQYSDNAEIADHTLNIAEHSIAIKSIFAEDMSGNIQKIYDMLAKEQDRSVPRLDQIASLTERSQPLIQISKQTIDEINTYSLKIKDMLDNGVNIDGTQHLITSAQNIQRLENILSDADLMKNQYLNQINIVRDRALVAENDVSNRVLNVNGAAITLDNKGYVSSYTTEDKTHVFKVGQRPMLIDQDANIYNKTVGLNDDNIALALYSPRRAITQIGEEYQSHWRSDLKHLRTIEDKTERGEVKQSEEDLVASLRGKNINDAISKDPNNNYDEENEQYTQMEKGYPLGVNGSAYTTLVSSLEQGSPSINFAENSLKVGDLTISEVFHQTVSPKRDNISLIDSLMENSMMNPDTKASNDAVATVTKLA